MASEERTVRRGGRYCVAGAPNQQSCKNTSYTDGIKMHQFPADPAVRAKWAKFVQKHRRDFGEPLNKYSALCSAHFEETCYTSMSNASLNLEGFTGTKINRVLIKGSLPTRDTVVPLALGSEVLTERRKRQRRRDALAPIHGRSAKKQKIQPSQSGPSATSTTTATVTSMSTINTPTGPERSTTVATEAIENADIAVSASHSASSSNTPLSLTSPGNCNKCISRTTKCNTLQKGNRRLRRKVAELKQTIRELKSKIVETEGDTEEEVVEPEATPESATPITDYVDDNSDENCDENEECEPHNTADWVYASMEESTEDSSIDDEGDKESLQTDVNFDPDTPAYEEPKFIVFYRMLLSLFTLFCFKCKEDGPRVSVKSNGTMVSVTQHCWKCKGEFQWRSQPLVRGRYPAGNLLLSFAILMAGASISKVLLIFRHMGISVYAVRTYFKHQRKFIFPTVLHHWESYREDIFKKLKGMKDVVWSGDGRFDSMGHSAKYGVYTMLCTTILKICHFEVVQSNETGGSQQTEVEGCKRCFTFLAQLGLAISVFVSDRHRGIAKWIRECNVHTTHYYDIWHVAKSVTKQLLKASKEKGCDVIRFWIRGIKKHLYWCATSSRAGFESLIIAKWKSFMRHVANKHKDHPDPLYKECNHGQLEPRKWITIGSVAYDKLQILLTNKLLLGDIKKLSSDSQTSCLEGFHATLNHWHPKMMCFSWLGTVCRHTLASLHFNENVKRETETAKDGTKYVRVVYPKYKLGEEVVRDVTVAPTYGYVDAMKKLLFSLTNSEMEEIFKRYSSKAPASLTSQFQNRVSKEAAIEAHGERQEGRLNTPLFPTGEEQDALKHAEQATSVAHAAAPKRAPICRTCQKPMRGHSKANCMATVTPQ